MTFLIALEVRFHVLRLLTVSHNDGGGVVFFKLKMQSSLHAINHSHNTTALEVCTYIGTLHTCLVPIFMQSLYTFVNEL